MQDNPIQIIGEHKSVWYTPPHLRSIRKSSSNNDISIKTESRQTLVSFEKQSPRYSSSYGDSPQTDRRFRSVSPPPPYQRNVSQNSKQQTPARNRPLGKVSKRKQRASPPGTGAAAKRSLENIKGQEGADPKFNIDACIQKLLDGRTKIGKYINLPESDVRSLTIKSREILLSQPMLLELDPPLKNNIAKVCGDVHGQYYDLLRFFEYGGYPPNSNYLFLGDYVDRGRQSIETICLLLAYKIKYPENFFILRGNHECASINRLYGFFDECKRRYNIRLWKSFTDCFNVLPIAAIIGERIFCCHGGLSPELKNMDQIEKIHRPCDVPELGLMCDLLWSDPDKDLRGWGENDRGVSVTFGADVVGKFNQRNDLDLVCRAHQVVEDGYEFFANRQLVTLFSAPNYCNEFDNAGAMMSIDENLCCSFQILRPHTTNVVPVK